jgi:hypothetical protein
MASYAEYLKSNGATEEEIKILDTPTARRAYERMEASVVANAEEAKKLRESSATYEAKVEDWYRSEQEKRTKVENEIISAKARADKAESVLRTAHERGMIDVAKDLGYEFDKKVEPEKKVDAVDTSKFVTQESLLSLAEKEADSIAWMNDIAAEHVYLFNAPLRNARELRAEATRRKVSIQQVWEEKYKVPEARTAKEAAATQANEDRIRKDERTKITAEFADKYGNPDVRPLVESRNFLVPRKESGRDGGKQPWDAGTDLESGSNDRVRRATQNALKAMTH